MTTAALFVLPCALSCQSTAKQATNGTTGPEWYEIARTPDITAYVDTGRIERVDAEVSRVWLRFVFTEPTLVGSDSTAPLRATEAKAAIDCCGERAMNLEMAIETVSGMRSAAPTPEATWMAFKDHPLGDGVFLVACRAAGTVVQREAGA